MEEIIQNKLFSSVIVCIPFYSISMRCNENDVPEIQKRRKLLHVSVTSVL